MFCYIERKFEKKINFMGPRLEVRLLCFHDVNCGPVGPKPGPVDPAKVRFVFDFKNSLIRSGQTSAGPIGYGPMWPRLGWL
jgi:hypothetical protein